MIFLTKEERVACISLFLILFLGTLIEYFYKRNPLIKDKSLISSGAPLKRNFNCYKGKCYSIDEEKEQEDIISKKKPVQVKSKIININSATLGELQNLPYIGAAKAHQIIEYRKQKGLFKDIHDVKKVKGIGPSISNKISDYIIYK